MRVRRYRAAFAVAAAVSLFAIPAASVGAKSNQINLLGPAPHLQKMTSAEMAKVGLQPANQKVIVLLKNQYLSLAGGANHALVSRSAVISAAERPFVSQMQQAHVSNLRAYTLISAISAKVSHAEAAYLRTQAAVRAVVPDRKLYLPKPVTLRVDTRNLSSVAHHMVKHDGGAATCNASKPLLEPEALTQINDQFQNPKQKGQAISLATGAGVTVAFMADGVSFNDGDFVRPNGQSVFKDVEDFGGSGGIYQGGSSEGMLDASSIGAQGNERYFVGQYTSVLDSAFNMSNQCPVIKVVGAAPGASLVDLQVFGTYATTSGFLQAIQYAVDTHVNVLNQSFGSNPYPDADQDPTTLADKAAVADGVTIVASTGDAGINGTQGSPSTVPGVIAAGASTSFQIYQQLGEEGMPLSNGKVVDNGVSSLSSGGPNQAGTKSADILAPGDLNWAVCDPGAGCTDSNGDNVGVFESGGTSESSPLTAGVAALVIQSYRKGHGGASPTPQVVQEIITSSATNLDLPSNIQGAGLLNAYKAVVMAKTWGKTPGKKVGPSLAIGVNGCTTSAVCNTSLSASGAPGAAESWTVNVTNTGGQAERVSPKITNFQPTSSSSGSVTLHPATDPFFYDPSGFQRSYQTTTTNIAANTDMVNFSASWDNISQPGSLVRLAVYNPSGAFACYSLPQGSGNGYGSCMVHNPPAGTWKLALFTRGVAGIGYAGPVNWTAASYALHSDGSVSPASKQIMPGKSAAFVVHSTLPATTGDGIAGVDVVGKVGSKTVNNSVVPVIQRAMIPTTAGGGGSFGGTLLGGNGRPGAGDEQTYQFNIPAGQNDVSVGLALHDATSDNSLEAVLTNPSGVPIDVQSNVTSVDPSTGAPNAAVSPTLQLYRMNPEAGTWTLTVMTDFYSGPTTSEAFTGTIAFDAVNVAPSGIPDSTSTSVSPSSPVSGTITITNTGNTPEMYYADPRLNSDTGYFVIAPGSTNGGGATSQSEFLLPTQTNTLDFMPSGSDASNLNVEGVYEGGNGPVGFLGNPDVFTAGTSNSPTLEYTAPEIPSGAWAEFADNLACSCNSGPADANDIITSQAAGLMKTFDDVGAAGSVETSTGDFWTNSLGTPLALNPGQSGQIAVQITPTASTGTVVQGNIYVDTLAVEAPGFFSNNGAAEELSAVPYAYTVGS